MDDVMVRSRYPRRSIPVKRRKRPVRTVSSLPQTIIRQLTVSVLILLVAVMVKSINSPVTNFINDKIQFALKQNIEIKSIYEYVDNMIVKLKNVTLPENNSTADKGTIKEASQQEKSGLSIQQENTVNPETSVLAASMDNSASTDKSTSTDKSAGVGAGLIAPVKGVLSSSFGERNDPVTNTVKLHEGIDIDANEGESIVAALGGTVVEAGSSPSYGNYLKIRHAGGLETVYAHCSVLNVVQGREVKQGDVIAKVGDSGASVGVHLHFEVWKDGKPVNPLDYISLQK